MASSNDYLREGLGYGLSQRSRLEYVTITERRQMEQRGLNKVRTLIEWAHTALEAAKVEAHGNIKMWTDLNLNWTPERVLTTYKQFESMCRFIKNPDIWRQLDRKERKFIADAYSIYIQTR